MEAMHGKPVKSMVSGIAFCKPKNIRGRERQRQRLSIIYTIVITKH